MFCPECGYKIEDEQARFCPECGTCIEEVESDAVSEHTVGECSAHGFILTNCRLLAEKLGVPALQVKQLIEQYIMARREDEMDYLCLDVDHYTYRKRGFLGWNKSVSLRPDSPWEEYMELLTDAVEQRQGATSGEVLYLFIIGSNDVIPMPRIVHPVEGMDDRDIDTDLLWAYPYGAAMVEELKSLHILQYDQRLLVGRLPVGEDTGFEELAGYLQRAAQCGWGIPMQEAYGQCDPHWQRVSTRVAQPVTPMLRDLEGRVPSACYAHGLVLSPGVTLQHLPHYFHPNASIYYFNLHGSNAREASGYYGCSMEQPPKCHAVMAPAFMEQCGVHNVVVCEACYGARHIGMDRNHSTLLSALYHRTLLFLGSSRVAWGDVDGAQQRMPQPQLADVVASTFMEALGNGYSAGKALFIAKAAVMKADPHVSPYSVATVAEFNLFGDPSLLMDECSEKQAGVVKDPCGKLGHAQAYGCRVTQVEKKGSPSLLQQVRAQVDANVREIHDRIGQYLYAQYGIAPREVDQVLRLDYPDGYQEMNFNYKVARQEDWEEVVTVITSTKGDIRKVFSTR